jgi:hypothetical protein|tara:strand:- start:687 stop:1058 length:372 start_codon:yes stop_codon:yes gene_type:complete
MVKYQEEHYITIKLNDWNIVDNVISNLQEEQILGEHAYIEIMRGYRPNIKIALKDSLLELVKKCLTRKADKMELDYSKIYMKKGNRYICITDNELSNNNHLKNIYLGDDTEDIEMTFCNRDYR